MIFFIKKRNSKYLLMISILIVCMISLTLLINETRKNSTVYLNKNNNYTELYDQNNNETNFIFIGGYARSGTTLMVFYIF